MLLLDVLKEFLSSELGGGTLAVVRREMDALPWDWFCRYSPDTSKLLKMRRAAFLLG